MVLLLHPSTLVTNIIIHSKLELFLNNDDEKFPNTVEKSKSMPEEQQEEGSAWKES